MRTQKKFLIIGVIVVAVAGVGLAAKSSTGKAAQGKGQSMYYCPMHPTYTSDRPGDCPICNMKLVKKEDRVKQDICYLHNCPHARDGKPCPMLVVAKKGERVECPVCKARVSEAAAQKTEEKKILYWTDPMIPGYKADKPGKSPMGMDLVPVYEEETPTAAAGEKAEGEKTPEGYAAVLITPQKQQTIGIKTAPVEQRKMSKTIRTVGTIAHDPELYQAETEYIQAIQALERARQSDVPEITDQAQRLVESSMIRLQHMGLSEEVIADIGAGKEAERSLLISTPGEPVWVYARIYEYELPLVRLGAEIVVDIPSLPGKTFKGNIRAIDPLVDPTTRTTRIRAQVQNEEGQLRPDMYVNVTIDVALGEILALPEEAVFDTGTKKIVFVDKGQGLFEPRDVTLGAKAEGYYELKEGLGEGETVVTSGNFLIDSESRLKAAMEGMSGAGEGGHQHGQ